VVNTDPPNLFDAANAVRLSRNTDPDTSHLAARSQSEIKMTEVRTAIHQLLWAHRDGLTDAQIAALYQGPRASASGLRTRRAELVAVGMVEDSGQRALTESNRKAIIWRITRHPVA
jgi:hypothetical protein